MLACRRAVQLAAEVGVEKVELELDSKGVATMLTTSSKNLSAYGPLVEEIKTLLQGFSDHRIKWVRRTANTAAHIMAKEGVGKELCKVWFQSPPECILHVVAAEIPDVFD